RPAKESKVPPPVFTKPKIQKLTETRSETAIFKSVYSCVKRIESKVETVMKEIKDQI
ncbi:unnamed protein product, partial [Heterotrigona itama]